jgi:hypothetical protein
MFNLFHSIFELVSMAYSTKIRESEFHAEGLSSGFIRLCYLSFVKDLLVHQQQGNHTNQC